MLPEGPPGTSTSATDRRYNRWLTITSVALAILFALLGRWQGGRVFRPVDGYSAEPAAVAVNTLIPSGTPASDKLFGRQATVSGTYSAGSQRLVGGKSVGGAPAIWVVTTLRSDGGREFYIVRGWTTTTDAALIAPPPGEVMITARIEPGSQVGLAGFILIRTAQDPPDPLSLQPVVVAAPVQAQPRLFHLQNAIYVVQWFLLVLFVAIAWWRLRRRNAEQVS